MRWLRAIAWRVSALVTGRRPDRELAEEIEAHLELHAADNERAGMRADEARRQAQLAFGSVDSITESLRERRGLPFFETLGQDLRYAVRGFRRNPGFTAAALVVLALGIGANTAIFTVVNAVLLRPLPYPTAERLVMVWHTPPPAQFPGMTRFSVSAANYRDWEQRQRVFDRMAVSHARLFTLTGNGRPEQVQALGVSAGFFEVIGVTPEIGRSFTASEDQPGRNQVVVLSHRLWRTRFGGDPAIVGRHILLDGTPHTVVGVMGARFTLPGWTQAWTPLGWTEKEWAVRGEHSASVYARLKKGVAVERAQAEMTRISKSLEREFPEDDKGWGAVVLPLREQMVGDLRASLLLLLGAVGFVLLIACANVANLVLARTLARRREMAVRLALGAGSGRVVRQILTETTLLAFVGAAIGLGLAAGGVRLIAAYFGERLPKSLPVEADGWVFVFTAVVALVAGLAAGIAPAWRLTRGSLVETIKQGGGRSDSESGGSRVRATLVVVEVALSLVLLIGAGLMIRSLMVVGGLDPGFDPRHVLTASVAIPETRYKEPDQQVRFFDTLLTRLRSLPGVESAGLTANLPLVSGNNWPVAVVGRPQLPMSEQPQFQGNIITPGLLRSLKIRVVRGRDITAQDGTGRPAVALVSEAMVRRLWPGQDPIGQRLVTAFFPDAVREVVGVVGDVKERGLTEEGTASIYLPLAQIPTSNMSIVLRTKGVPAESLGPALEAAVREVDPDQPVMEVMPMERVVADSTSDRRFTMLLLAAFAGLALALTAVGIYSVLAYAVRRRSRELGIRVALGADARGVIAMVVKDGLRLVIIGVGIGLVVAVAMQRAVASLLFGIGPGDPLTFAAVSGLLLAVALISSALPAWRAARVDPTVTLRDD